MFLRYPSLTSPGRGVPHRIQARQGCPTAQGAPLKPEVLDLLGKSLSFSGLPSRLPFLYEGLMHSPLCQVAEVALASRKLLWHSWQGWVWASAWLKYELLSQPEVYQVSNHTLAGGHVGNHTCPSTPLTCGGGSIPRSLDVPNWPLSVPNIGEPAICLSGSQTSRPPD